MKEFRIWVKEKWKDTVFKEINFLKFDNVRSEEKGLGGASARILLNNYDPFIRNNWENGTTGKNINLSNWWVFVEAVDLISSNQRNSANYQPPSNSSSTFIWWGYCGEYTKEIQRISKDSRGTMNLYEIGHWFAKQKINYEEPNANGFNPIFDSSKGTPVGNKDIGKPYATYDTYGFEKNGRTASIDPSKTDNFFTCKEAINHIVMRSIDLTQSQFKVRADWSLVNTTQDGDNAWLNESESIDSFEGKSLAEALENILDTFTWTYEVDKTTNDILVRFKDRYLVGTEDNPLSTVYLDSSNESFFVTSEQQVYDHIQLIGDRILFYNSLTTYTPMTDNKSIGIFPKWTTDDRNKFLLPKASGNRNFNQVIEDAKTADPLEGPTGDAGVSLTDTEERNVTRELSHYKALRQKYSKNVYQDFQFGYCYPENPVLGGECLATWTRCGDWNYPEDSADGAAEAIACYPKVTLQKPLTEASNDDNILEKKPKDLILNNLDIERELLNSRGLETHQTPACTEMKYEDVALQPDSTNESFLRNIKLTPTFYYRTFGGSKAYTNGVYPQPVWLDGTQGGNGLMSSKMSLDWDGVTLDSDEPEVFACYYDWIYQTARPNDVYVDTVRDFNVLRNEWKNNNVGASAFDYYHRGDPARDAALPDWSTVTHWGRMVFSFGSYSKQRLVLDYGEKNYTKTLIVNDEGYKMAIARRGYVTGITEKVGDDGVSDTEIGFTLNYNRYDKVIVNDMPTMAARMTQLWNYWSRPKSAVKIVNAMFSSSGNLNRPLTKANLSDTIGMYIGTIKNTDGSSYDVNSYVSSVEYDFSADQPRIIIQTEYPDSPKSTREKTVKGVWKKRKNDWNRDNL